MDENFVKTPKLKPPHKRRGKKKSMFWSPLSSGKPKRSGSSYYRKQMRKMRKDL